MGSRAAHGFPMPEGVDNPGLEEADDAFGEGVVAGAADGSNREIDPGPSRVSATPTQECARRRGAAAHNRDLIPAIKAACGTTAGLWRLG